MSGKKVKKILKKLINAPLRFHHQDIHEELEDIKMILSRILVEMEGAKND